MLNPKFIQVIVSVRALGESRTREFPEALFVASMYCPDFLPSASPSGHGVPLLSKVAVLPIFQIGLKKLCFAFCPKQFFICIVKASIQA